MTDRLVWRCAAFSPRLHCTSTVHAYAPPAPAVSHAYIATAALHTHASSRRPELVAIYCLHCTVGMRPKGPLRDNHLSHAKHSYSAENRQIHVPCERRYGPALAFGEQGLGRRGYATSSRKKWLYFVVNANKGAALHTRILLGCIQLTRPFFLVKRSMLSCGVVAPKAARLAKGSTEESGF